ncbi:GAF and ANTAR domain-containing protein [Arthrobacter deserti]|uniref:GAF and ANTAR domain-containing protein n=1 Tax=Arthrobacter deserti TaxID=1742687 RepID=A0ABX1JM94_9MICC|nr:GAF and ANTAR domain-containing protein [Arthrobacter deserti]
MTENYGLSEARLAEVMQDIVQENGDVEQFLADLVKLAARTLSAAGSEVACGISLLRPRTKTTIASSSEHARQVDELQYRHDTGPCLRAAREDSVFYVKDATRDTRFRPYLDSVARQGIRSILAAPIPLDGEAKSALNLYAARPDAFDAAAAARAEPFAGGASKALRLPVRMAVLAQRNANLKAAMDSRTTIDLAIGIIMGQNRCGQEDASRILKSASTSRNAKPRDVAASVVDSVGGHAPVAHFDG